MINLQLWAFRSLQHTTSTSEIIDHRDLLTDFVSTEVGRDNGCNPVCSHLYVKVSQCGDSKSPNNECRGS